VERIRSRGAVHRKFTGFLAEGAGPIAAGTKVVAGEKEVGEVTSSAYLQLPEGNKTMVLGYIRREVGVPGREVMIGEAKATVVQLPITDAALGRVEGLERRPA
jgi:glycine cleavage system aminomethyltransferase T